MYDQTAALDRLIGELEAVQRDAGTPAGSLRTVRAGTCDGDTPLPERDWVRAHADIVLTNPDFLHFSLLPGHERWTRLLRGLRYIVIDECHAYRGILGAHVALVLRRLLRLVARLRPRGPQPVVLCASATAAEPALTAARLIGAEPDDVVAVTDDGRPLLNQAEDAGLTPENGCRMGICFSCTRRKTSGVVRNVVTGAVSSAEEEDVQICVSAPVGDVDIAL